MALLKTENVTYSIEFANLNNSTLFTLQWFFAPLSLDYQHTLNMQSK